MFKKARHVDEDTILVEVTLDGRSIGRDWGWGDGDDHFEIASMPANQAGQEGYYALRFGELVSIFLHADCFTET